MSFLPAGGRDSGDRLVFSVSTIKDSPSNVERFISRNLAAGIDHMVVFVEGGDSDVMDCLKAHPHATGVRTGPAYWQGQRPTSLNSRQCVNANLVNVALSTFPGADWLFHIDGDEVVSFDREALRGLQPGEGDVLKLPTLEAVSQHSWPMGEVAHFKRQLGDEDLILLAALGVIQRPDNRDYFRGHLNGKSGVRPGLDVRLGVHNVHPIRSRELCAVDIGTTGLLHYDAFSGDEFVRKWMAHWNTDGSNAHHRPSRERLRVALNALLAKRFLSEHETREYVELLYNKHVADDYATLLNLRLLEPTPEPRYRPAAMSTRGRYHFGAVLARLIRADKRYFTRSRQEWDACHLLTGVASDLRSSKPLVATRVDDAVELYLAGAEVGNPPTPSTG